MDIPAVLPVRGMLVCPGGMTGSDPALHFGAVSWRAPEVDLYVQRRISLGETVAKKSIEIFS